MASPPPPAAHSDADGNGLSDALEMFLADRGGDDKIEVVVTWTGPVDLAGAGAAVGHFEVSHEFRIISGFVAEMSPAQARALSRVPGVFRVEENFVAYATNEEANQDYGTAQARLDTGLDGSGVDVCVIDTGVDAGHEQLDSGKVEGFRDLVNGLAAPYDDQGHGTHVAAIAGGDGIGASPNAARYAGVAPGAGIYAAKVLGADGSGTLEQIVAGIEWCVYETPAEILSLSLGTSTPSDGRDALSQAVNGAVAAGKVVIVAAGNSGDGPQTVGSPGAAASAITVGAASKVGGGLHLAPFSSRGPNLNGELKPDVASPGVAVVSADAGTISGYFSASGTSMATPFVSGTVALALERDPSLTPDQIKGLVTGTARDAGTPGPDDSWGHGLLDGYAVATGVGTIPLPARDSIHASVSGGGLWRHQIPISGLEVGEPLGLTVLIDGELICSAWIFGICLISEWVPDLDARLIAPDGTIADSTCPAGSYCGAIGSQETLIVGSAQVGTYTLEIYPYAATGGAFDLDIFHGPPLEAPTINTPPVADAGPDVAVTADGSGTATVHLDGSGSLDPDGQIISWVWSESGAQIATGETAATILGEGVHNITLTVTDDGGAIGADTAVITVAPAPPPPIPGVHIGDLDGLRVDLPRGSWQAGVTVTVHNELESSVSGADVTFTLSSGGTAGCTTGADGTCAVWSPVIKKKSGAVTFTVVSVVGGYLPDQNHDSEGDSTGTAITVARA
jgi:serine protease AprX